MSINQRIKERRLFLGMTSHKALAEKIGVSWQTVQLWEKDGGTAPKRDRLPLVAAALETTPEWLLYGDHGLASSGVTQPNAMPTPPTRMQWVSDEEYQLLSLYRTTDLDGKSKIMDTAEMMPKVLSLGIARNEA